MHIEIHGKHGDTTGKRVMTAAGPKEFGLKSRLNYTPRRRPISIPRQEYALLKRELGQSHRPDGAGVDNLQQWDLRTVAW